MATSLVFSQDQQWTITHDNRGNSVPDRQQAVMKHHDDKPDGPTIRSFGRAGDCTRIVRANAAGHQMPCWKVPMPVNILLWVDENLRR